MSPPRASSPVRRALAIHAVSTVLVSIGVAAVSSIVSAAIAIEAARNSAAAVAGTVAHAVAAPLAYTDVGAQGPAARATVIGELQAFIDAGVIERAKIWYITGDEAVVLYSDEPRNEGTRRPFDPALAARLDDGEVVIFEVPDDAEHTYESGRDGLLEAFIGFEDAAGLPMRLELYLLSAAGRTRSDLLAAMLPVALVGPLVLGAATLPLAVRLARRLHQREAERRALLHTALTASDRERRRLAARLHDGVIQDLASVGLTLDSLGLAEPEQDPRRAALLLRASEMIDADLSELRGLLTELAPPDFDGSLERALADLAEDLQTPGLRIELHVGEPAGLAPHSAVLLFHVARELMRNAIEHAAAEAVRIDLHEEDDRVVLLVADDGGGFDPERPAPDGHFGLALIRQAVVDSGGEVRIASGSTGTTAEVRLPLRDRHALPTEVRGRSAARPDPT